MGKLRFKFKVDVPDKNTEKIIKDSFMNFISDISKLTDKPITVNISNKSELFEEKVEDEIDNELNKVADNNNVEYYKIMNFNLRQYYSIFDNPKWTYDAGFGKKFDSVLDAIKVYEKARGNIKLIMLDDNITESKLSDMLESDQFRDYAEVIGFNKNGVIINRVFFMQDTRMFEEEYDPYLHEKYFVLKFKGKDQYLSLMKFGDTVKPYRSSVLFKFNDEGIAIDHYKEYVDADVEYVFINDLDKYSDEELMVLQAHTKNSYYEKYLRAIKDTKKAVDDNSKEFVEMAKEQTEKMLGGVLDNNNGDYYIFSNYNQGTYYTDLAGLRFANNMSLAKHYDSMTKALSEVSKVLGYISLEVIKTNDPDEVKKFINNDPDTTFYQVVGVNKYDIIKERYFFIQDTRKNKAKYYPYFDSQYFIFKVYGKEFYLSLNDNISMNDKPMPIFTREKFKFNDEKTAIGYFEDYTHAKIVNISKSELEKYDKEYMIIEVQHYANDKLIETKYFRGGESKEDETEEEVDIEPVAEETKPEFIYIIKEGDKYINKITDLVSYTNDIGRALVFNNKADAYYAYGKTCNGAAIVQVSKGEAAAAQITGYTVFEIHKILSSDLSTEAIKNLKGSTHTVDYYKVVYNNPVKEKKDENPAEKRIFVMKIYDKEDNKYGWLEDIYYTDIVYTDDIRNAKRFDDINQVFKYIELYIYNGEMIQISEKEAREEDCMVIEIQFYIGSVLAKKDYSAFYKVNWRNNMNTYDPFKENVLKEIACSSADNLSIYKISLSDYMKENNLSNEDMEKKHKMTVDALPGKKDMIYDTIYIVKDTAEAYIRKDEDTVYNFMTEPPIELINKELNTESKKSNPCYSSPIDILADVMTNNNKGNNSEENYTGNIKGM